MTTYPTFTRFPHFINVRRQEDGKLTLKTNTHQAKDIPDNQLSYITLPYCGVDLDVQIDCPMDIPEDMSVKDYLCGTKLREYKVKVKFMSGRQQNIKLQGKTLADVKVLTLWKVLLPLFPPDESILEVEGTDFSLKRRIEALMNKQTDLHIFLNDDHPVMRHHFLNLSLRPYSLRGIEGICGITDRPILFCGAGPSLLNNIDIVKRAIATNSHIVIAGGSAMRILSNNDIFPHFALAFDPHEAEWDIVFKFLSEKFIKKVPLITTSGLNHKCAARYHSLGGKLLMSPTMSYPGMMKELYPREPSIMEGRVGVSTMMPYIADYMGAKDLTFVGVDLNFGPAGETYADGQDTTATHLLEDRGFATKLLWMREAADIVRSGEQLDIKLTVVDDSSYLHARGVAVSREIHCCKIIKLKPLKYRKLKFAITKKSILILEKLVAQAHVFFNTRKVENDSMFFNLFLESYHMVQEFREQRTGDFNLPLLRAVALQFRNQAMNFLR